jgi:hypothetical protein
MFGICGKFKLVGSFMIAKPGYRIVEYLYEDGTLASPLINISPLQVCKILNIAFAEFVCAYSSVD